MFFSSKIEESILSLYVFFFKFSLNLNQDALKLIDHWLQTKTGPLSDTVSYVLSFINESFCIWDCFFLKPGFSGNVVVQQRRNHALQTSASPLREGGWEGGDGKFWRDFIFVFFSIQVFAVNVFSQFWCIYEFLPRMLTLNMVRNLTSL